MKRRGVIIVLLLAGAALVAGGSLYWRRGAPPAVKAAPPYYAEYRFDGDNTIYIGSQTLLLPTGLITETMRRDQRMHAELEHLGKTVVFHDFLKGKDIVEFLKAGKLQGGVAGDMPVLTAAASCGAQPVGIMQYGFLSLMAPRWMLLEQMRGRTMAVAQGSNAHYLLLNALELGGLSPRDLANLVFMDVTGMPAALQGGRIDGYAAWEPTLYLARQRFPNQVPIHRAIGTGYFFLSDAVISQQAPVARALLGAQYRAMAWIEASRKNLLLASEWSLQRMGVLCGDACLLLSVEAVADLAARDIIGLRATPRIPDSVLAENALLQREFEFLQAQGLILREVSWREVRQRFNRQLAAEVEAELSRVRMRDTLDWQP